MICRWGSVILSPRGCLSFPRFNTQWPSLTTGGSQFESGGRFSAQDSGFRARMERRETVQLSLLVAVAISIYTVESLLPSPLPWVRLGLSNAIVLLSIVGFGFRGGLLVSVLRTLLGSLVIGTFLSPAFLFALVGGVSSALLMGTVYRFLPRTFSLVGISILGALTHNGVQLTLASLLFIKRAEVLLLLPLFGLLSVSTGAVTGAVAHWLTVRIRFGSWEPRVHTDLH